MDDSVEIIRRYADQLSGWVSERDRGQAHAINKGLAWATGEIFGFINSDDCLADGALFAIAEAAGEAEIVAGWGRNYGMGVSEIIRNSGFSLAGMLLHDPAVATHQPAIWQRTADVKKHGGFREDLHFLFDYDLLLHLLREQPRIRYVDRVLAHFRLHPDSKTVSRFRGFAREQSIIHAAHLADPRVPFGLRLRARIYRARAKSYHAQLRFDRRVMARGWPGWCKCVSILVRWLTLGRRRMMFHRARELWSLLKAHRAALVARSLSN